jgi:hypothetical protein
MCRKMRAKGEERCAGELEHQTNRENAPTHLHRGTDTISFFLNGNQEEIKDLEYDSEGLWNLSHRILED